MKTISLFLSTYNLVNILWCAYQLSLLPILSIKEEKNLIQNEICYINKYIIQDEQGCMETDQLGQVEWNRLIADYIFCKRLKIHYVYVFLLG